MCTIFLQSITLSGLILLEEKSLGVLIFYLATRGSRDSLPTKRYSKIFLESSIVACINFSVMPLKERKL